MSVKQYKAAGEEVWRSKTDKVVSEDLLRTGCSLLLKANQPREDHTLKITH